ncbi:SFRICE_010629 [Gryllus bimaculatus]|nr:SFRICE_010629 [Gryllus bimaculatus]
MLQSFQEVMAIAKIKHIFKKYPILANSVVYGTLYTGAEFSQQTYTKKIAANPSEDYDVKGLARFSLFGTTIGANVLYHWYIV